MNKATGTFLIGAVIVVMLLIVFGSRFIITVPPGHVAVATLFGDVQDEAKPEGPHLVNPLLSWVFFDAREKTHKENANVPSQDQLQTRIDVSIQYRLIASMAPEILQETGNTDDVIEVHLIPKVRSLLREQGKTIERAEDFFQEKTQENLQTNMQVKLEEYLRPKGIEVSAVLIRDITLPPAITRGIEQKKEREQEVEKQKAELERFRTEQQQKIAQAEAEKEAATQEAERRRLLADAEAYQIQKVNEAIANNPAYLQLKAIEALEQISKDPASKIYFLNSDSPQPLPLMNIGDAVVK